MLPPLGSKPKVRCWVVIACIPECPCADFLLIFSTLKRRQRDPNSENDLTITSVYCLQVSSAYSTIVSLTWLRAVATLAVLYLASLAFILCLVLRLPAKESLPSVFEGKLSSLIGAGSDAVMLHILPQQDWDWKTSDWLNGCSACRWGSSAITAQSTHKFLRAASCEAHSSPVPGGMPGADRCAPSDLLLVPPGAPPALLHCNSMMAMA